MGRYIPTDAPAVLQMMAGGRRYEWQAALHLLQREILSGQVLADLADLRDGAVKILGPMDLVIAADLLETCVCLHDPRYRACQDLSEFFRDASREKFRAQ